MKKIFLLIMSLVTAGNTWASEAEGEGDKSADASAGAGRPVHSVPFSSSYEELMLRMDEGEFAKDPTPLNEKPGWFSLFVTEGARKYLPDLNYHISFRVSLMNSEKGIEYLSDFPLSQTLKKDMETSGKFWIAYSGRDLHYREIIGDQVVLVKDFTLMVGDEHRLVKESFSFVPTYGYQNGGCAHERPRIDVTLNHKGENSLRGWSITATLNPNPEGKICDLMPLKARMGHVLTIPQLAFWKKKLEQAKKKALLEEGAGAGGGASASAPSAPVDEEISEEESTEKKDVTGKKKKKKKKGKK